MCVGPHITYTKALKAFKLTGVSGAYWKGDKDNKMLTRINGIAFRSKEELAEWERCARRRRSATTARSARRWRSS
jgi:threonyl-tRNA synthetase